jgi:hypothetical protein
MEEYESRNIVWIDPTKSNEPLLANSSKGTSIHLLPA